MSRTKIDAAGEPAEPGLSISAVERDTGLSKDTLRVWERRYGFPNPGRDALGERFYPAEQVDRLRLIRRLMDGGRRPGKIVGLPLEALRALAEQGPAPAAAAGANGERTELARFMELTRAHQVEDLRRALSEAILRMGLDRFVAELVAPLNRLVGEAWACGDFEVFEEHLYTEAMQGVLRTAIGNIPSSAAARPRVLLSTFPAEPHGLGLLMAEAVLALEGCRCLSLGVQTPIRDIALAAAAQRADVVALSFSAGSSARGVLEGLADLRGRLPAAIELWAGGGCVALKRRPPAGVRVIGDLAGIGAEVARWRDQAGPGSRGATNSVSTPV
ncbi:MAG: MerR family transcriptional regulator [Burkholderiaceae bacterium]|nr:MerR family transcriptional regulator [Burkholderiaceae bacterium]